MKGLIIKAVYVIVVIVVILCLASCERINSYSKVDQNNTTIEKRAEIMKKNIVIGESTLYDLMEYYPIERLTLTASGAECTIVLEDGSILQVEIYGKEMIIGSMKCTNP